MERFVIEEMNVRNGVLVTLSMLSGQRFEITTSTGYRAVLPACVCEREPMICPRSCNKYQQHCHGAFSLRHEVHALALAREVCKTYGSANRPETKQVGIAFPHRPSLSVKAWADSAYAQALEGCA